MRGVTIPIPEEEQLQSPPWGDRSAVKGEKYAVVASAFRDVYDVGARFLPDELLKAAEKECPSLFEDNPEATGAEIASMINAGGRHPSLGDRAFRLHFSRGFYRLRTFLQVLQRYDLTEEIARTTANKRAFLDSLLQDAEEEIAKLPAEAQTSIVEAYNRHVVTFCNAMRQLRDDISLAITDLQPSALGNGAKALKNKK